MSKLKKITLVVLLLIVVLAGFFFFRWKAQRGIVAPPGTLLTPELPIGYKGKIVFEFAIDQGDFSFQPSVPLIQIATTQPYSKEAALAIANDLGFNFEPLVAADTYDGTTYIWHTDEASLRVRSQTRKIEYNTTKPPLATNKQLNEKAFIEAAETFLYGNGNQLATTDGLSFSSFVFYKVVGSRVEDTSMEDADIIQVNFSPKAASLPFFTINPQKPLIYVQILTDGSVYRAQVIKLGEISETPEKYQLLGFEEVVGSSENIVLISLADNNINLPDLKEDDIRKATINEIQLAYLYDTPTSKFYQPIYLLKGTALVRGFTSEVSAVFYLPAISSNP